MRDYASLLPVHLESDLLHAGWNGCIDPYPGITPKQFAMQALRRSLVKKYSDGHSEEADRKALRLFLEINEACSRFSTTGAAEMTEIEAIALGEAKSFIYDFFHRVCKNELSASGFLADEEVLTLAKIGAGIDLGNGANIGVKSTDFLSKLGTSTMAATNLSLYGYYCTAIRSDPLWSSVESTRHQVRGLQIVKGSRLSFVPKTSEISRTICTEPVCNMLLQKGIANVLEERLTEVCGIDLSLQPDKNRKLALLGSKDGRFGTIDLSSASDSMSLGLVREFFPDSVVNWLMKTRSPVTILPDGTEVELHMVSSMGNAFTFPLQTIFFTSLVIGAYRALDIRVERPFRQNLGNFAVFGDDIIVVRQAYDLVVRLLCHSGFKVNNDKSFNTGLFRESCGHDYFHGYNVRGVYIKTLHDVCDKYSAINRLNEWSAIHRIYLPSTCAYLMRGVRFLPVPYAEMDTAGVKVHDSHLRRKWFDKATGALIYRYAHIESIEVSVSDVESSPPKIRGWFNNYPAVLLAALAGTVRKGKIVTRSNFRRSIRTRVRKTPRWNLMGVGPDWDRDRLVPARLLEREFGINWKVAVELNLNLS